ncbi:MAG: hypothetical protein R3F43_22690 [bacterium]
MILGLARHRVALVIYALIIAFLLQGKIGARPRVTARATGEGELRLPFFF